MNNKNSLFEKNRAFFKEFLRRTDQKEEINKFLIENYTKPGKKLKILGLGTGSGEDVIDFLTYLNRKGVEFQFVFVDPSRELFDVFKVKVKKHKLSKNISHIFISKFEKFCTDNKFDIIIASHVFYYLKDWEPIIKKIISLLKTNGDAFIFMQSEESDNFKFRNTQLKYIYGKKYKEKSAEQLVRLIKKLKLPYKSRAVISKLDVSGIVSRKSVPSRAKSLLSFLIRKKFDDLETNVKLKIVNYFKNNCRPNNSSIIFSLVDKCIILKK